METKKSAKANLEKRKIYFLEIGLILALGLCFAAFEWSEPEIGDNQTNFNTGYLELDSDIEPPIQINPPEYQKPEVIPETLTIVDDGEEVDTTIIFDPENHNPPDFSSEVKPHDFEVPEEKTDPIPVSQVPHKPLFPGGDAAMLKFFADNMRYPALAKELNISGKVYVYFVVGTDGKVCDVGIVKSLDPEIDKEAIRVVSMLPTWTPGRRGEKPVPVSFIIPINFKLE
jgi:periplasmic protein TonB